MSPTETIEQLSTATGREALAAAEAEPDPGSLAAAARLRASFPADLAAAALSQIALRRQARTKFGDAAARMLFTRDGLEQATRPAVAAHHARRIAATGAGRVVDLGCGIGSDALAFAAAGLQVVAVEKDPVTAAVARHNLALQPSAAPGEVVVADAKAVVDSLLTPGVAVFCDPARRSGGSRLWRVQEFTPSWDLVRALLDGSRPAGVKLGPALPHSLIPPGVSAQWVSDRGETVEAALWAGVGEVAGSRSAVVLPEAELLLPSGPAPDVAETPPRRYLYEPNGAVIRAGGVAHVARLLDATLLDRHIAYLTGDTLVHTRFAEAFEVLQRLPYQEKLLRQWVAREGFGTLEIKKRGVEVDPAGLRRRLKPRGEAAATLVLSRTPEGACVLHVRRVPTL